MRRTQALVAAAIATAMSRYFGLWCCTHE